MKKINVIDLDKTLIPYDSFRLLITLELKRLNISIIIWTLMRQMRLISLNRFKRNIALHLNKKYSEDFFKKFAFKLFEDIDSKVLKLIQKESLSGEINVLLSASPNLYVHHLIDILKWEGCGSYFIDSKFIHLHGNEKLKWLRFNYGTEEFEYNFSISDSSSDSLLLEQFKKHVFWTR